jgi:hypothetical protein
MAGGAAAAELNGTSCQVSASRLGLNGGLIRARSSPASMAAPTTRVKLVDTESRDDTCSVSPAA